MRGKIKGLGEIILRVNDMQAMSDFYGNIIGLNPVRADENFTFFKIADGYGGHYQVLALFAASNPTAFDEILGIPQPENRVLHHFALEIDQKDYHSCLDLCREHQLDYNTVEFEWVSWRSIFIRDPEKNIVELVCYDPSVAAGNNAYSGNNA